MHTIMDLCFLCIKDYNNCVVADERIVSQVEYLLPEITIIKLGIPLRICSVCDGALCAFSKFKQSSVQSSRCLEARIKGAQGPPLHTGSPPVVDDSQTSGAKPENIEEIFIKEEYVEETPLDTNRAFLNPTDLVETIIAEPHNQLHKDRVSQNIQLHTDTNAGNIEQIIIKEEQMDESTQYMQFYNNIIKKEYVRNSLNYDTDRQLKNITEDEIATLNTSEKVLEGSFGDSEDIQIGSKKITRKSKNRNQFKKKIQKKKASKTLLVRHMKKNHLQIKVLSCTVCKQVFIYKYDLNKHMDLHNGIKNCSCSKCKKRFFNMRNLKQHIKLHTDSRRNKTQIQIKDSKIHSGVKEHQCKLCEKSFTHKSSLTTHIKIHSRGKAFQCEVCGKSFTWKANLNSHIKNHYGVKEFHCEICNKSFTHKAHLNLHIKIHSGVKDFQCDICEKSFTQKFNLTKHIKIHSGVKDFQCKLCEKSFTNKSNLTKHVKLHSGVKEYQCEICDKLFTQKCSLTDHIKIHSGVKDFQCEICEKSFLRKTNLTRHMKIH